jgi:uncharacterized protein (TIGR03067 family)
MRAETLAVVVIGCLLAASVRLVAADEATKQEAIKKELKKFEGTWTMVSAELSGVKVHNDVSKNIRVIIKGDTLMNKDRGTTTELTIVLDDPSKKPRAYSATGTRNGDKQSTVGIYDMDGDTLKVCFTSEGGERPNVFSTKGGTQDHPITRWASRESIRLALVPDPTLERKVRTRRLDTSSTILATPNLCDSKSRASPGG